MICEKCGKTLTAQEGEYRYDMDSLIFVCKECTEKMDADLMNAKKVCDAIDSKKEQAEKLLENRDQFEKILKDAERFLKKIPGVGNLLGDVPVLISLARNYIEGKYTDVAQNTIVAVVAAVLYLISPVDLIPDGIPGVGLADDAAVVAFCIRMIRKDLEKFKAWRDQAYAGE